MKLYEISKQFADLNELAEREELPEQLLADTLEGLTGDLQAKATNVAMLVRNLESDADTIDDAAKQLAARAQRVRSRAQRIRLYLQFCMESAAITKISCPWFTLAIVKNPKKVVISERAVIPEKYMRQPPQPPPAPDKGALKDALERGENIEGVWLEQGERLDIKV